MKVHITLGRKVGDERILLDDVDVTNYVLYEGFDLDVSTPGLPRLSLTLVPDSIELDGDVDVLVKRLESVQ